MTVVSYSHSFIHQSTQSHSLSHFTPPHSYFPPFLILSHRIAFTFDGRRDEALGTFPKALLYSISCHIILLRSRRYANASLSLSIHSTCLCSISIRSLNSIGLFCSVHVAYSLSSRGLMGSIKRFLTPTPTNRPLYPTDHSTQPTQLCTRNQTNNNRPQSNNSTTIGGG